MKLLFVTTAVLVLSIVIEAFDPSDRTDSDSAIPNQLNLTLHILYDTDFSGRFGPSVKAINYKIDDLMYLVRGFFKLPSFPTEIIIEVINRTRLPDKYDLKKNSQFKKFRDFKREISKGDYSGSTNLFLLLSSYPQMTSGGPVGQQGDYVCSTSKRKRTILVEYLLSDTDTAFTITEMIALTLGIKYDDRSVIFRTDNQGNPCNKGFMVLNKEAVWSNCSVQDFIKYFNEQPSFCLEEAELTLDLNIHIFYDNDFYRKLGPKAVDSKIRSLMNKVNGYFQLPSFTPKIIINVVNKTGLNDVYDVNGTTKNKHLSDFQSLVNNGDYPQSTNLFVLLSASQVDGKRVPIAVPRGYACSESRGERTFLVEYDGSDANTARKITKGIAIALKIDTSITGRNDTKGNKCSGGLIKNLNKGHWSSCSIDDFAAYMSKPCLKNKHSAKWGAAC